MEKFLNVLVSVSFAMILLSGAFLLASNAYFNSLERAQEIENNEKIASTLDNVQGTSQAILDKFK